MDLVASVLAAYPKVLHAATVTPLGNRGGFSGARLWYMDTPAGTLCLRAGAESETANHLLQRHALMAQARRAGLLFVPAVLSANDGRTVVEIASCCWEIMEWMPGRADFHRFPTPARLSAGATALAKLHGAWEPGASMIGSVPAVARRLETVRSMNLAKLSLPTHPLIGPLAQRARRSLTLWLPESRRLLQEYETYRCTLQPCLRDVWHDHLLYEEDTLTGLVDYAAAGFDAVAVDLARMLGSLIEDDDARWSEALVAYRWHRTISPDDERLARALDRTGVVGGLCNWLRWMCEPQRVFEENAATQRIEGLLQRVERW